MDILISILLAVVVSVIGYRVCKWLDRHDRGE